MKLVIVRWDADPGGYWLDPRPYINELPDLVQALPPGAGAFAQAPEHYDFQSERCVKDLWFDSLSIDDAGGSASIRFRPNDSKHPVGLHLLYQEVTSLEVVRGQDPGVGWLGSLLLDELLPSSGGVSHELALTGGTMRIDARDLEARWG